VALVAYLAVGIVVLLASRTGGYNCEESWTADVFVVLSWPIVLARGIWYVLTRVDI
jgi:hypothetical protein